MPEESSPGPPSPLSLSISLHHLSSSLSSSSTGLCHWPAIARQAHKQYIAVVYDMGRMFSWLPIFLSYVTIVYAQSYGNASYSVNHLVKAFHLIPHFTAEYKLSSKQFDIDTSDINNEYAESVIVLPITITLVIFIAFCVFELSLCCRICCKCCTCVEDVPARNSIGSIARWTARISHSREDLTILFFLFAVLMGVCCSGVVWAVFFIVDGNDNSIDATHNLQSTANSLESSGDDLEYYGNTIYNFSTLAIPSCSEAQVVQDATTTYLQYVGEYNAIINPIPGDLSTLEDFLNDWGEDTAENVVWNSYALFLILLAIMIMAYFCKNKPAARVALGAGMVVQHITLVMFCLFMIALTVLADFCMAPTDNALSITPDSALEVATYYATCNGTNPFASSLSDAYSAVGILNASLTALTESGGPCDGNPYLLACFPTVDDIYSELGTVEGNIHCEGLQQQWVNVFNESACHDYYLGLYILFYTMAGTTLLLFILLVIWSLLYQYFGDLWNANEHIVEVMSTDSFGDALVPGSAVNSETASVDGGMYRHYSSGGSSREVGVSGFSQPATSKIHYGAKESEDENPVTPVIAVPYI